MMDMNPSGSWRHCKIWSAQYAALDVIASSIRKRRTFVWLCHGPCFLHSRHGYERVGVLLPWTEQCFWGIRRATCFCFVAYMSFEMSDFLFLYPDWMFFSSPPHTHTLWLIHSPLQHMSLFSLSQDPFSNSDRTLMLTIAIYAILTLFLWLSVYTVAIVIIQMRH